MSQQSSLTQSAHSVRQVLTAYTPSSSSSLEYHRSDARIVENGFAAGSGMSNSAKVGLESFAFLSLSRSHFFDERKRQLSCGSHNCRFVKATEQARSCVMDLIFPGEFTRAGAREHDGALRRFEYRRHLMFAGTELDLKGAFWEWSNYSHRDDLLERRGPSFPA